MRRRVTLTGEYSAEGKDLATRVRQGRARNVEMFKAWLDGETLVGVAKRFAISHRQACHIKKKDQWDKIKKELYERFYAKVGMKLKAFTARLMFVVEKDFEHLEKKVKENLPLTKDERMHYYRLLDRVLQENRLSDGKPTDISGTTGVVEHSIKLPPGVRRFGVIPADPRVKAVEHEPAKAPERRPRMTVDDVDDKE